MKNLLNVTAILLLLVAGVLFVLDNEAYLYYFIGSFYLRNEALHYDS